MKRLTVILVLIGAAASGAVYYSRYSGANSAAQFRTVAVTRGDLLSTIGATGTVEPEEVVDVGAQVMGLILEFGADPRDPAKSIDYGSVVEKDTVLARIDPTPYQAALDQAEALLARSRADLLQLEAKRELAEQDWMRAESLRPLKAIADSEYDSLLANSRAAKANVAVGEATIRQNEAAVRVAQTNLGYTTIKSPVRGVILDRRVNVGQTVVASLNAPSLFLIAKDLQRMQVWASVNEADIGRIREGMPVQFTVDAHPGERFQGKVTQIRMNATMSQNVVTYTVVVTTDNSSGKLLPYLTANVKFEEDRRSNVLLVPNAALRWKPQPSQMAPSTDKTDAPAKDSESGCLWVLTDAGFVRPVPVVVGASDGTMSEVSGDGVHEGLEVVAGDVGGDSGGEGGAPGDGEGTKNPFLPKPPKGARPPPGPM